MLDMGPRSGGGSLIEFLARHSGAAAAAGVLLLGTLAAVTRAPVIDGSLDGFELPDSPHQQITREMARRFGPAPSIQIGIVPRPVALGEVVRDLVALEGRLKGIAPGAEVVSLHSAAPFFRGLGLDPAEDVRGALERVAEMPLLRSLVGESRRSLLVVVRTGTDERVGAAELNAVLAAPAPSFDSVAVFSIAHLERDVRAAIGRDLVVISMLVLIASALILLAAYRSVRAIAFVLLTTAAAVVAALATLSLLSFPLNVATMLVIPAAVVLSVADAVHLLTGYTMQASAATPDIRLRKALRNFFVPSLLTSVTTAVAFLSLTLSDALSIRQLGMATAAAVLLAFVLTYLLGPQLLVGLRIEARPNARIERLIRFVHRRARPASLLLLVFIPLGALLAPGLAFNTPPDHFFPRGAPVTRAHEELDREFGALASLYVLVEPAVAGAPNGSPLDVATTVSRELERVPHVKLVASARDLADQAALMGISLARLIELAPRSPYLSGDGAQRLLVRADDPAALTAVVDEIGRVFERHDGLRWAVTGPMLSLRDTNRSVVRGLLRSFVVSSIVILLVIAGLTRTLRGGLIALLANAIPIAAAFATFSLLGLELSVLSSAVLVICLGLVVDDTLHAMFRLARSGALEELPYSLATTSFLLSAGFLLFVASRFVPIRILGGVLAFVLLIALAADLTVVPWLYQRSRPVASP